MWSNDEIASDTAVEVRVSAGGLIESDLRFVDRSGNLDPVAEDRHHERAVVFHDRRLPGVERVRLRPAETKAQAQPPVARLRILGSGILGDVETGDPDR